MPVFTLRCTATLTADPAEVWKVWTDVANWFRWDVSKEMARLDGPFAPGTQGWAKQRGNLGGPFTITAVEPERRWTSECPLPLGKIVFDHTIEPQEDGRVLVAKDVEVHGGFAAMFRLLFAAKMQRDIAESFARLQRQVAGDAGRKF
ncbi:MAG: SRPBCC family protein [Micromonosporaceae bacterium]